MKYDPWQGGRRAAVKTLPLKLLHKKTRQKYPKKSHIIGLKNVKINDFSSFGVNI